MKIHVRLIALCLIFVFSSISTFCQTSDTAERPRIGLALSGGAAKGFAHIGVIRYLEELGIEVDYITGTSMGSIVGGLHAMGYHSDRMTKIASSQDWSTLLSGYIPLKDVSPLEKKFHQKFPFYFSYKDGNVSLPKGVINSQKLDILLAGIFSPAYEIRDFDELVIPFRCVAVNIENGEVGVFSKGSLNQSVRASMAIPLVFTPEEVNGNLYVDGGLIRNFPVQEVIDMGADIVIGVYVGSELESKDQLKSMFDIFSQSTFMMSSLDSKEQAELVDIYIAPDVKMINSFAFEEHEDIIRRGYQAAKTQEKALKKLAEKLKKFERKPRKKALPIPEYLLMNKIDLPETISPFDDLARYKFGGYRLGGLNIGRIDKGISKIAGTNLYEKVSYAFKHENDKVGIDILAKPRESILISGSMNAFGTTNTSFILHTSMYNKLSKPSSLNFTARISEFIGLQGFYQSRIGQNKNLIINLNGKFDKMESPFYKEGLRQNVYHEFDSELALYFGVEPNNELYAEIGGGIGKRELRQTNFAIVDLKEYDNLQQFLKLNAQFNNLDRTQFPRQGIFLNTSVSYVFGQSIKKSYVGSQEVSVLDVPAGNSYLKANIGALAVFSVFDAVTSESRVYAGYKSESSLLDNFKFGGLLRQKDDEYSFVGIEESQLHFDQFWSFRQDLRVNIFGSLYIGAIVNYIKGQRTFLPSILLNNVQDSFLGYGGGLYFKTPLGPLSLEIGRTTKIDDMNTSVGFGFRYIY